MFGFIKTVFFTVITFFSSNLLNVNSLECVSLNKQECKEITKIIDVNSNEPIFCPFSIKEINVVEVVMVSMIRILNCLFQMSLKT